MQQEKNERGEQKREVVLHNLIVARSWAAAIRDRLARLDAMIG